MKIPLLIIALILFCFTVHSQQYEFGKVSEVEINQETHALDPEAVASVIYKKGSLSMVYQQGWKYVYEVEARIKIYKNEGFKHATISVPLYRIGAGNNEIFSGLKAFTHNSDGGKITKDRVKNEGIFDEDYNEFWDFKKFTFPNVKEGSVLEYSYKITSPYIVGLPEFYFQAEIPVDFAEYTLKLPEYLGYKSYSKGYISTKRDQSSSFDDFTFTYVPKQNAGNTALGSLKTQFSTVRYTLFTTTYSVKDVPKLISEDYVNNIDNYLTSIKHELEWVKMPETKTKTFSQTWEDVVKAIYKSDKFGKELNQKDYFESELSPLLSSAATNKEKVNIVYEFVKQKMSWNGNYGYYTKDGLKSAYKNRTGNVAEINLMLTAMLRHAGLIANPVLVSTKSWGIPLFPTQMGFNYVVSAVELGKEIILLDATNPFSSPNILPERTINWFGRIIRNDESSLQIDMMPKNASRTIVNMDVKINSTGSIEGRIRNTHTDHSALSFRNKNADVNEKSYINELQNRFVSMDIDEYSIQNKIDPYKPIVETYKFKKENAYDKIGDKIYFSPLFFFAKTKNPFTAEKRELPIDFKYPISDTYMINITLPDGFKVESMPESTALELPEEIGKFGFMISNTENNIQLRVTSEINVSIVPASYYETLKKYFKIMVEKETEKVVLTKI
ncbi:MAG: DUF3857 domain-containing protein [Flavobacteriales bacterium]|jgi:transglutaminase-like putative cysteine protease|nr:DUF3857 domain-containing protein [Flavobacteriales bacterium]